MQNRSILLIVLCTGAVRAAAQEPVKLVVDTVLLAVPRVHIAPLTTVPRSAWGTAVSIIDSTEIERATAPTLSELLQARRPGVRVLRSGGLADDGSSLLLREPTSIFLSNRPLVIVDGVRVDNRQYDFPLNVGGMAPSRIDDIEPDDIERIEVLQGPAAALYGDGAANGVIFVTTRSGGTGPLRLSGRVDYRSNTLHSDFPANYRRLGTSPSTGQPVADCSLNAVAVGQCTPTGLDVWNPLEQASPFRTAPTAFGHASVGGSLLGTELTFGVGGREAQGVLPHDQRSRLGARAKVARDLPAHLRVEASGGSVSDHARLAEDGNWSLNSNLVANGLLGSAEDDALRGYLDMGGAGDSVFPSATMQHRTAAIALRWTPWPWLEAAAITGRDHVYDYWHYDHVGPVAPQLTPERASDEQTLTTSGAHLSAAYGIGSRLRATTGLGLDRHVAQRTRTDSVGDPNTAFTFAHATSRSRQVSSWLQQQVIVGGQWQVNAALQHMSNDIYGAHAGRAWFPSANVSWSPDFARRGISDVRLRAAYAEAAGSSDINERQLTTVFGVVAPAFQAGEPEPKLERTRTFEVGVGGTVSGSATLDVTAFLSRSVNLWGIGEPTPFGNPTLAQNAAMENRGVEALLSTTLLRSAPVEWSAQLSLALLRNRITKLPIPVLGIVGSAREGYSFGGVWARPYTYLDGNRDGIIARTEVQGDPQAVYLGPALPTIESALSTQLALRRGITLSALLDYRGGHRVIDRVGELRCLYGICRGAQDPTSSLADQAAAEAAGGGFVPSEAFVSDGSFLKLREVAVRWRVPAGWSRMLGMQPDITIAGRNLATWTRYRGIDPEVSSVPPDLLPRQEFATVPIPRTLVVRLDLARRD